MNQNPIGIFDSGVGGLTVLAEIKKKHTLCCVLLRGAPSDET